MAEANTPTTDERLAALEQTVEALRKENQALKKGAIAATQPQKRERPTIPDTTFTVGGKNYKFVIPAFRYKGEEVTALDALSDESILKELVAKNSGAITTVE